MAFLKTKRKLSHLKVQDRSIPLIIGALIAAALLAIRPVSACNRWAVEYMRHALNATFAEADPSTLPGGFSRAKLWLAQEDVSKGNAQEALSLVEPQASHGDPFALRIKASALEAQGNYQGALAILIGVDDYRLLNDLGDQALHAGQLTDALAAYQAAIKASPEDGTLALAAFLDTYMNDHAGAELILKTAMAAYPDSRYFLSWSHLLGENLMDLQRFDEAEAAYQNALVKDPKDWQSYIGLGWVHQEQNNDFQRAMSEFQRAIEIDPSRGDGYYATAQLLTLEKRFDEADSWYRLAIDRNSTNKSWYLAQANNSRSGNDLTEALALYRKIEERYPDFAAAYYEMAWTYRLNDQPEEAQKAIDQAISLMNTPRDSYWVRAGQIYEWSGDINQALQDYQNALAIDPNNVSAQAGIQRLTGGQ